MEKTATQVKDHKARQVSNLTLPAVLLHCILAILQHGNFASLLVVHQFLVLVSEDCVAAAFNSFVFSFARAFFSVIFAFFSYISL